MPTLVGAVAVLIAALVVTVVITVAANRPQWHAPPAGWEKPFVVALNDARARQGLAPVAECRSLTVMATRQVQAISELGYVAHRDRDGAALADRARSAGYTGWQVLGENAAQGLTSPGQVVARWLVSDEHRRVLLNGAYTHVGVARLDGRAVDGAPLWTAEFGRGGTCGSAR